MIIIIFLLGAFIFCYISFVTTAYRDIQEQDIIVINEVTYTVIKKLPRYRFIIANVDGSKTIYVGNLMFKNFKIL